MKLDLYLDVFLTVVTLSCAIPAWLQMILQKGDWQKLLIPVSLLTASLFVAVIFENLITFGPLTLDYSLRFAALGIPLGIFGIVFALRQNVCRDAPWIWISSGASLVVWGLLVTMH